MTVLILILNIILQIFGITFNPKNSLEFVTFGVKHLKFWKFDEKIGKLQSGRGLFGSNKVQSIICATYLPDGTLVSGTFGGDILFWNDNKVSKVIENIHSVRCCGFFF